MLYTRYLRAQCLLSYVPYRRTVSKASCFRHGVGWGWALGPASGSAAWGWPGVSAMPKRTIQSVKRSVVPGCTRSHSTLASVSAV